MKEFVLLKVKIISQVVVFQWLVLKKLVLSTVSIALKADSRRGWPNNF